jgi:hypothetical protein
MPGSSSGDPSGTALHSVPDGARKRANAGTRLSTFARSSLK